MDPGKWNTENIYKLQCKHILASTHQLSPGWRRCQQHFALYGVWYCTHPHTQYIPATYAELSYT